MHRFGTRRARRCAEADDDRLDRELEARREHVVRQVRQRGAREARPVALVGGVLAHEGERGRPVEPERVHEVDPALGVGTLGFDHPHVGTDETGDDVADGRWRRRVAQRLQRGPAPGGEVAGPPGDHRADQRVAGAEVVVDGGTVLARGVGDVADGDAETAAQEELLGHVEQLRLGVGSSRARGGDCHRLAP